MAFPASILAVVCCIWQPVMNALQTSLETGTQGCFSFLTNWVVGQVNTLVSSWRGDFEEVPDSTTSIVGAEETLAEIRAHLNDDSVGIIGIYGMGGAGKTTLLRRINNDLSESRTARGNFDLGIWVTVSKEVSIPKIQKQIADRLGITDPKDELPKDESQCARILFQALSKRRFLVLLDDLWAKLDLVRVGIPVPTTNRPNCKIAFTTRSLDVCSKMDANRRVKVKSLGDGPSWELFRSKVGTEVDLDNSRMYQLAKQVVRKCGGLPLALITVGRAMADRRQPAEWELAVKNLDHKAEELGDMKDEVLSQLKFSYDYLKNNEMRSALLYCAMYPEDAEINRVELIEHWIGEGMLDDDDDVDDGIDGARNRGHRLITDLQHSCLLEAAINYAGECVRIHDAVRDLTLWLNRTSCDKVDGFMTAVLYHRDRFKIVHPRGPVKRAWMSGLHLTASNLEVQKWPPNSYTLLLNDSIIEPCVLQGIFNCMRALRVLDLSNVPLQKELLIEIGYLQELQYLNLSHSSIGSLPKELGKLVRLRQLDLAFTLELTRIPREAIVGLSSLQVLNMRSSGYEWRAQGETPVMEVRMVDDEENKQHSSSDTGAAEEGSGGRQLELSDLEGLQRLQELEISVKSPHALQQLSRSESLRRRTRVLEVRWKDQGDDDPLRMTFNEMFENMREIRLVGFGDGAHPWVGDLRISLDLFPRLEVLAVAGFICETTRTIVLEGANAESFRELMVTDSSGWKALELVGKFPGLEEIGVRECEGMEELLLDEDNEGTASQQDTIQEQLNDSRFPKLKELVLDGLRDLKSIGRRPLILPSLEDFEVTWCPQLRRLPLGPKSAPKLKKLVLSHLTDLKSVGQQPLSLPSLEVIHVEFCPQLRRLPLGRGSAPKLKMIGGEQEWWDGLEWGSSGDDPNIRNIFAPLFRRWGRL